MFDLTAFVAALDAVRVTRNLSWRQVAIESGNSPSTFTRMQQGKYPDVDTLAKLVNWARLDANPFLSRCAPQVAPLAAMIAVLEHDHSLPAVATVMLRNILTSTYQCTAEWRLCEHGQRRPVGEVQR